jgi:hypothetical protein
MPVDSLFRPPFSAVQPGAYSAVDASALQGGDQPTAPFLVIVGAAFGGQPNVLQRFRDPQALKNRLRSGAGYDCARFAMGAGANPIGFMRAGSIDLAGRPRAAERRRDDGGHADVARLRRVDEQHQGHRRREQQHHDQLHRRERHHLQRGLRLGAGATNQNIADAINGKKLGYNASQYVSATVGAGAAPLAVLAQTPLAGGSDGTSSALQAGDWTSACRARGRGARHDRAGDRRRDRARAGRRRTATA